MSVTLSKNSRISLSKEADNQGITLEDVAIGLGWDINNTGYNTYDLDAWAVAVENQKLKSKNLVYFGNKLDSSRLIHYLQDNLTGEGEGDDETITIALSKLPENYEHILIGVTIYKGSIKKQSFKDVNNAFIRLYDRKSNKEICKYSISNKKDTQIGNCITLLFGILSKVNNQWEFTAVGEGSKLSSITGVLKAYSDYSMYINKEYSLESINNISKEKEKKHMAVSLSKGGKVSLAKAAADAGIQGGLSKLIIGLGWSVNRYDGGADFDLDASAFLLGASGKVRSDADFIFYNQPDGPGVHHTGDNRTGAGDGDDEQIQIDLTAVPADVEKIDFTVTIDQADTRNQNFGMVEDSYVRVVDEATGTELVRYDLGEDFSVETAIVVAELYRHNGEWKFNAIGSGFSGGLAALCNNFGVNI